MLRPRIRPAQGSPAYSGAPSPDAPRKAARRSPRRPLVLAVALLALAAGCRSGGTEPPDTTLRITARSGAELSGPAGARLLAVPLAMVTDAASQPVSGTVVSLSITSSVAGFSLPETKAVSGSDGVVRADVLLGQPGTASIRIIGPAPDSVEATATVTAVAALQLSSISPESFGVGDEVTITGQGLPGAESGAMVSVGGVRATIISSSSTTLKVRAPACVPQGSVEVKVTLQSGASSNALVASYTTTGVNPGLQIFEAVTIPAAELAGCLSLAGDGARYLVVPQYATSDDVASTLALSRPSFVLGAVTGGGVVASLDQPGTTPLSAQARLDRMLRLEERALAPRAALSGANPSIAAPMAALAPNSTRAFKVLSKLSGGSFNDVTARLKFIGTNVLIYVDELAPAGGLTDSQLTDLGNLFDRKLYGADVHAFGSPTDIDGNGQVVVLMTPTVNKLTTAEECASVGFVTGFFYGLDLLPNAANSNRGEVFYSMVADPTGATGSCKHSVEELERLVPATFIHELQHMISYGQHVLVRGGRDETLWLNEGLSHIAEELGSLLYENDPSQPRSTAEQIFPDSSQGFINGNMRNAYDYLRRSTNVSVTLAQGGGTLEERGAAWLFLRWLGDQKGEGIYRRLVETSSTGVRNIEDKAGEPFARLFGDFAVAAYSYDRLSGVPEGSIPARYRFLSRDFRRIFQRFYTIGGGNFDRPYPIVLPTLNAGATANNSMVPGTATWYELRSGPGARVSVTLQPGSGTAFDPALGAQVTVLRLPLTP